MQPMTHRATPAPTPLTQREAEIARHAASGDTNKVIARELNIAPGTVGHHLSNIFRKLGIGSRRYLSTRL